MFKVDNVEARPAKLNDGTSTSKWHEHYLKQELACMGVKNLYGR